MASASRERVVGSGANAAGMGPAAGGGGGGSSSKHSLAAMGGGSAVSTETPPAGSASQQQEMEISGGGGHSSSSSSSDNNNCGLTADSVRIISESSHSGVLLPEEAARELAEQTTFRLRTLLQVGTVVSCKICH